jgi:hypothetical protein
MSLCTSAPIRTQELRMNPGTVVAEIPCPQACLETGVPRHLDLGCSHVSDSKLSAVGRCTMHLRVLALLMLSWSDQLGRTTWRAAPQPSVSSSGLLVPPRPLRLSHCDGCQNRVLCERGVKPAPAGSFAPFKSTPPFVLLPQQLAVLGRAV